MTPHQKRTLERRPHLADPARIRHPLKQGERKTTARRIALPVCSHRGKVLDKTSCRLVVFACSVHGTCSNNSKAGLTTCPCDFYSPPTAAPRVDSSQ